MLTHVWDVVQKRLKIVRLEVKYIVLLDNETANNDSVSDK